MAGTRPTNVLVVDPDPAERERMIEACRAAAQEIGGAPLGAIGGETLLRIVGEQFRELVDERGREHGTRRRRPPERGREIDGAARPIA